MLISGDEEDGHVLRFVWSYLAFVLLVLFLLDCNLVDIESDDCQQVFECIMKHEQCTLVLFLFYFGYGVF